MIYLWRQIKGPLPYPPLVIIEMKLLDAFLTVSYNFNTEKSLNELFKTIFKSFPMSIQGIIILIAFKEMVVNIVSILKPRMLLREQ